MKMFFALLLITIGVVAMLDKHQKTPASVFDTGTVPLTAQQDGGILTRTIGACPDKMQYKLLAYAVTKRMHGSTEHPMGIDECTLLSRGSHFIIIERDDALVCIKPDDNPTCYWTSGSRIGQ